MDLRPPKVIVIAGPTASGKSALALAVAEEFHGTIINADSQQCYADLALLTARPTPEDMAHAPHRLFGDLAASVRDSAPAWATRAATAIQAAAAAHSVPIVAGGTGLYLQALMTGMPDIPVIPPAVRAGTRALHADIGLATLHARLAACDPVSAARIKATDTQRVLRAWEVHETTGRPLSAWQADAPRVPIAADYFAVLLMPPREELVAAAEQRLDRMLGAGALAEVAQLVARGVPTTAPVFRVLGAGPVARHLAGEIDFSTATGLAKAATRQYAKRQATWFRHQFFADLALFTKFSESICDEIFSKIRGFLLT